MSSVTPRGALIVLEGPDRSGKSTNAATLVKRLKDAGVNACYKRFPERSTGIGKVIDEYLRDTPKGALKDQVIHLLFAANRWETADELKSLVEGGTTVVIDRYSHSGVCYSVAKGMDETWCFSPEVGLPKPDIIFFLSITPEEASKRGDFGAERYEKLDFQRKVFDKFKEYAQLSQAEAEESKSTGVDSCAHERCNWYVVDASQELDKIQESLYAKALEVIESAKTKPLGVLTKP